MTKTNACVHSVNSVPLHPSGGASVDEYECVQNEISYETVYYIAFCCCATSLLLNSVAVVSSLRRLARVSLYAAQHFLNCTNVLRSTIKWRLVRPIVVSECVSLFYSCDQWRLKQTWKWGHKSGKLRACLKLNKKYWRTHASMPLC